MARCEQCGNDYHKPLEITQGGQTHVFDSFECAIAATAPRCAVCDTRIVGHGLEGGDGAIYCCGHCAQRAGVKGRA
jgi:hypothetical protein